jgi:hypothetical protein
MKTSLIASLRVACAWVVVSSTAAWGASIQNASFEQGETELDNPYNDLAAGWGRWGGWINRESGWKPTKSGDCLMGYHHWRIEGKEDSGFYQDITNVQIGAQCTFEISIARDKGTNVESIELRLEKMGGFRTIASTFIPVQEIKGSGWKTYSVTGLAVEGGLRLAVVIHPSPSQPRFGALKFDDASLAIRPADEAQASATLQREAQRASR